MKLNYIALLAAVAMLNVAPTVVFAQNDGNNTGSATSSSDVGTAPSKGTSDAPTGQAEEMMPHQQQGAGSATSGSGSASSSTDGGTAPATGAQDKSSIMGSDAGNGDNNGGSKSGSSSSY